jgi:hypothetical protein
MHSTSVNTSRITFNTAGVYHIIGQVAISGDTDYTSHTVFLRLNGATTIATNRNAYFPSPSSAQQPQYQVTTLYKVAANDYVELVVNQENTSAGTNTTVAVSPSIPGLMAVWVGVG